MFTYYLHGVMLIGQLDYGAYKETCWDIVSYCLFDEKNVCSKLYNTVSNGKTPTETLHTAFWCMTFS